jgi:hypothetical protein
MANTKVIGWTPQLDNALKKLIHNGVPVPANVSKTPVFRQQTRLTAGNAVVQGTISCYNDSDEEIAVYTAVCITGDYFSEDSPDGKESRLNGNCFIKGKAAKDDSLPWGIATCDIAPGGVGDIIIQGIAPALWTGNGGFVSPSGTGLIGSQSGRGEVISPAYKELPGIILLGGGSGGGAVDEYNGMHKLVLITDNSNPEAPIYKVCVCDGATYNPQTHTSKSSRVEVNGVSFDLDSQIFELKKQDQYVYIHFFPGSADVTATVEYDIGASLPENYTGKDYYYLIGRTIYTNGAYSITQDHNGLLTNGTVQIWWGRRCNDF